MPLFCLPPAVIASLHGMAEALQPEPSANPKAISLQHSKQQQSCLPETASNAQVTQDDFQFRDLGLHINQTPP